MRNFERELVMGMPLHDQVGPWLERAGGLARILPGREPVHEDEAAGELAQHDFPRGARRRRFSYRPPSGWQGFADGLVTEWVSAEFAQDRGCIAVWPAIPITRAGPLWLRGPVQLPPGAELAGPFAVTSPQGLTGSLWGIQGAFADAEPLCRDLVVFFDERFVYPLRLDARPDHHLRQVADFFDVVHSVQPFAGILAA